MAFKIVEKPDQDALRELLIMKNRGSWPRTKKKKQVISDMINYVMLREKNQEVVKTLINLQAKLWEA